MLRRLVLTVLVAVTILTVAAFSFVLWPLHNPHPALRLANQTLLISDATIYTTPDAPPLPHASLLIRNGRIAALGPTIEVPANAVQIPCNHCIVTAGFWNTHVHFTQPVWTFAAFKPAATLNAPPQRHAHQPRLHHRRRYRLQPPRHHLPASPHRDRLASRPVHLHGRRRAIPAPRSPVLCPPFRAWFIQRLSPQPEDPSAATSAAEKNIARGADLLKLFTGSYLEPDTVIPMPLANARAAVQVAHAHHQLAFAHPSDLSGVLVARDSGVDILAHAADSTEGVTPALLQTLVDRHMAMTPTLKMFGTTVTTKPAYLNPIFEEVRQFHTLGGDLLFGTDVGYMTDYTTNDEFTYLQRSGLSQMDILRMLTLAPATRFGVAADKGTLHPGALADLTILASDPAADPAAFSNIVATIRAGRIIYLKP